MHREEKDGDGGLLEGCGPQAADQQDGARRLERLADFLFETGMLRKTPRSGFQFLGSGRENVAEHSYRTALIGLVLADLAGLAPEKIVLLCLLHDFHEARTGDFNYVNKLYNSCRSRSAMEDSVRGTGLEGLLLGLWDEQNEKKSREALLVADADQLDLILSLLEERETGNRQVGRWLEAAMDRLRTEEGQSLARCLVRTDPSDWWFKGPDPSWWRRGGKK